MCLREESCRRAAENTSGAFVFGLFVLTKKLASQGCESPALSIVQLLETVAIKSRIQQNENEYILRITPFVNYLYGHFHHIKSVSMDAYVDIVMREDHHTYNT